LLIFIGVFSVKLLSLASKSGCVNNLDSASEPKLILTGLLFKLVAKMADRRNLRRM
jgi:hypothetical protein